MKEINGLRHIGFVTRESVNSGESIPLYESITPKGRPIINTLEGWDVLARKLEQENKTN